MKYSIKRGNAEIGKFELADIQALMNAGVILPTDYFQVAGMEEWRPVSSLFNKEGAQPPQVIAPPPCRSSARKASARC